MKFLEKELIQLNVEVNDAEEAIRVSGKLLLDNDVIEKRYIEAMVESFKENGPYIVLAPNVALPHARPEDGAKEAAVSMVQLKNPIRFGHSTNDPVKLVFALASSSSEEHIELLQRLSMLMANQETTKKLMEAKEIEEVIRILEV